MRLVIGQTWNDKMNGIDKCWVATNRRTAKHLMEGTYAECYAFVQAKLAEDNAKFKIKFDAFDGKLVTKEEFKQITKSLKSDNTKTWRMMEHQGQIKLKVWDI